MATYRRSHRRRVHVGLMLLQMICCHLANGQISTETVDKKIPVPTTTTPGGYVQLDAEMKNTTRYEGDTLRIKCEITGFPLPRYLWTKDGVPLDHPEIAKTGRYSTKTTPWGSRLKVDSLKKNDEGLYACEGSNRYGRQSTDGYLAIRPGLNPNRGFGKQDRDQSDLDLDPDSDELDPDAELQPQYPEQQPASEKVNPPAGRDANFERLKPDGGATWRTRIEEEESGFCQPYLGATCSRFLGNRTIFVVDEYQQGILEEKLTTIFTRLATSRDLSLKCGQHAIPALCFYTFPLCSGGAKQSASSNQKLQARNDASPPAHRRLCRDECEALADLHCRKEYGQEQEQQFGTSGKTDRNRLNLLPSVSSILPDCRDLRSDNCINAGISTPTTENDDKCFTGSGVDYRGYASVTVSNRACMRWSSVSLPYEPSLISISQHPFLADHNYCRNPDNSQSAPWCFVLYDNKPSRELCNINKCPFGLTETNTSFPTSLVVIIPCTCAVVVIVALLIFVRIRKRKTTSKHESTGSQCSSSNSSSNHVQMSALLKRIPQTHNSIAMSNITLIHEMREGTFGKIYRGDMVVDLAEGGYRSVSVMVRTLAMAANMRTQVDFWSDAERLSEIRHPNVTCLIGINHVEQPVCLVLECTSHSDLQEYLRANSDGDEEVRRSMLSPTIFISIAVQIGCGMEYLHGKGYIHRDLAARNILMADNGLVKVALFGTITSGSHYTRPPGAVRSLPVRWSSPEVVFFERFSLHSDVWSFGVVLWEIYSYGVLPYYSYSDMEVIEMLRATRILTCPVECPAHVYSLMVQCWHKTPPSRPDFVEVHRQLRQLWAEFANLAAASQLIPTNRSSSSGNSQTNMPTTGTSLTAPGIIGVHPVAQWLTEVPGNNIHMPLGAGLQHRYQKLPSTSNQPGSAQAKRNTPTASSASQKSSPASSTCNFKLNLYSTSNNAPPFAVYGGGTGPVYNCSGSMCPEQII